MGTSNSWAELDRKLKRCGEAYADLPKTQVAESALVVKKSVQGYMPSRLRGVGKNGRALNVRYDLGRGIGNDATATVFVTGPAELIENDTRPHRIPRERGSRARRRYAVIPGVGVRAFANHPGTKGQHPWAKGVDSALPVVSNLFELKGAAVLRRFF